MMTDKAWKMLAFFLVCCSAVALGAADIQAAEQQTESQAAPAGLTQEKVVYGTFRDIFTNIGVAMVSDSLNIRKEPKSDADIIGKMESYSGCSVLGSKHGWYRIKSGQVTGYVSGRYLAVGQAARIWACRNMKLMLRVNTQTLRVRGGPDTNSEILGRIHEGETYNVLLNAGGGWIKIQYKNKAGYAYVPDNGIVAFTLPEAKKADESVRRRVVNYAVRFVGNPYKWGGTNPNTGVDCSGFVQYVMEHAAGIHLDRTSREQAAKGRQVSASAMEAGDLLFYASGSTIDHVAMYIGDGRIIHAANRRSGIKISPWNYRRPVIIRRIIP